MLLNNTSFLTNINTPNIFILSSLQVFYNSMNILPEWSRYFIKGAKQQGKKKKVL